MLLNIRIVRLTSLLRKEESEMKITWSGAERSELVLRKTGDKIVVTVSDAHGNSHSFLVEGSELRNAVNLLTSLH